MSKQINVPPSPASLIEALRDIGYSIQTAIADIIDNSITANASNIQIRFTWNSGDSWLAIIDNGTGMTNDELINAMRFGSSNPLERRAENDLGRFGLGMKTASFSQCRQLTVLSKKKNQVSCCEWNLDSISKNSEAGWMLSDLDFDAIHKHKVLNTLFQRHLSAVDSGTIVLWEKIDRMYEEGLVREKEKHFNALIDETRQHLQLTFHRFLSPDPGYKKINITMNSDELEASNPFNPQNLATQELEQQQISIHNKTITVQPYILPHHSKISRQEYERYAGEGGYLHNQGFYIYRNRRLIIKGTWFRLIKKEELNKLIRIKVDIPNTLDYLWKIDVKKSQASPPEVIRDALKQVIDKIEFAGRKVYHQRGTKLSARIESPVWERQAAGGTIIYRINREHPLLLNLFENFPVEQKEQLQQIITMFENGFPRDMFFNDVASMPEQVMSPDFDEQGLELLAELFIRNWDSDRTLKNDFVKKLFSVDPFASNKSLTEKILVQKGYLNNE
jgi:hypothetical protein